MLVVSGKDQQVKMIVQKYIGAHNKRVMLLHATHGGAEQFCVGIVGKESLPALRHSRDKIDGIRNIPTSDSRSDLFLRKHCYHILVAAIGNRGYFFDLDMAAYNRELDKLALGIVPVTMIEVNFWQSRRIAVDALEKAIEDPTVDVPAPLRATYDLLGHYQSDHLQPYRYDQLAFTIFKYPADSLYTSETAWPLDSPPLEELFGQASVENRAQGLGLLLEGDIAIQVYQAIRQTGQHSFIENGVIYAVSARPLLPYESLESAVYYQARIPSSGIPLTTTELTCYSTDGVLEIP